MMETFLTENKTDHYLMIQVVDGVSSVVKWHVNPGATPSPQEIINIVGEYHRGGYEPAYHSVLKICYVPKTVYKKLKGGGEMKIKAPKVVAQVEVTGNEIVLLDDAGRNPSALPGLPGLGGSPWTVH